MAASDVLSASEGLSASADACEGGSAGSGAEMETEAGGFAATGGFENERRTTDLDGDSDAMLSFSFGMKREVMRLKERQSKEFSPQTK